MQKFFNKFNFIAAVFISFSIDYTTAAPWHEVIRYPDDYYQRKFG